MLLTGKLVRHYRSKHADRDLPDGLAACIPSMSHDELNTSLSQLAVAADKTSCVRPTTCEGENADSDDTQDFDVSSL